MANVIIDNSNLTNIANAIRTKKGVATTYKPSEMAAAIETITTGAAWGQITGTLSNQTDLQSALNTKATIAYSVSEPAGQVEGDFWFDIICEFTITNNLTNCTKVSGPTVITEGEGATLIFSANTGYVLPSSVTVTGATSNWAQSTGTLVLSNATDNVVITIVAEVQTFTITNTLTNCTKTSGANVIAYGSSETLVYTADTGYKLPASVTVTGATGLWAQATGTLVLSNPTSNISITITAEPQTFTITNNLTNCTKSSGPTTITYGTTATLVYSANDGCTLPDSVIVVGASYTWTKETGTLILSSPIANIGITIKAVNPLEVPLCLTANTAGSTVALAKQGSPAWTGSYSTDGTTWTEYIPGTTGAITLTNAGDKVYFKGDITGNFDDGKYLNFRLTGSIAASGNCNSMYVSEGFENLTTLTYQGCFGFLFYNCSSLTTPPLLPATTLSAYCYRGMFRICPSLTTAPTLPSSTAPTYCYQGMFYKCTSLTTLPILRSTSLSYCCYYYMFNGCTSLQVSDTQTAAAPYAWTIPATGTFTNTYSQDDMFTVCAGTRESNDMPGQAGQSYTYYTQNEPV